MRCAVCDEPFHRADGYQSVRGLVCSAECVEAVEGVEDVRLRAAAEKYLEELVAPSSLSQSPRMRCAAGLRDTTREGELLDRMRGGDNGATA